MQVKKINKIALKRKTTTGMTMRLSKNLEKTSNSSFRL